MSARSGFRGAKPTSPVVTTDLGQRFTGLDFGLLATSASLWGASFLFMAVALEAFGPGVITFGRILFGSIALGPWPASRKRLEPGALGRIALLAIFWLALPFTLFPIAEQWIDSALTGMLNAAMPLFTVVVAFFFGTRSSSRLIVALGVGFAGVMLISAPSFVSAGSSALGVVLVLIATVSYAIAVNLLAPLQARYGTLPVLWRAQLIALLLTAPGAIYGLGDSSFSLKALVAVMALGAGGTGLAFVSAGVLMGRVGPTRGSIITYAMPIVAIFLGVVFRNERLVTLEIAGICVVLVSGFWTSRLRG